MKSLFDTQEYQTVSQLTSQIKMLLESGFADVYVVGEISSLTRAGSGHVYLTLRDKEAVLRSVIWRSTASRIRFPFDEGMEVLARGRINVYAPRGDYQLVIEELEPKGIGAAELALKKLKEKLAKLGYFAAERKRPLPRFPRQLALVTSASGAAVRDMLEILSRRWPVAQVLVCPVRVQGQGAADDIAEALGKLNQVCDIDVILLGRGGGSAEDLAAFNEEIVARAIFHSKVPVVSAVGHEIDITIADMVADRRALTPSEAAELATPDQVELRKLLLHRSTRMNVLLEGRVHSAKQRLTDLAGRRIFRQPLDRIRELERRLDESGQRLGRSAHQRLLVARQSLQSSASRLDSLSPLNVLARGYSLTRTLPDLHVVRSAAEVRTHDLLEIRLHEGRLVARVDKSEPLPKDRHA